MVRIVIYVGPCRVDHVTTVLRATGFQNVISGTEKVYLDAISLNDIQATLNQQFGRQSGYKAIELFQFESKKST